jgi:hypothetical protein
MLGDFNLRDNFILPLLSSLEDRQMKQIVEKPTRLGKLLDLIIVNNPSTVLACDVYEAFLGDHLLTECTINVHKPKPLKKTITVDKSLIFHG